MWNWAIGNQETNNGLEQITSSRFTSFIERAAFDDAFVNTRRIGANMGFVNKAASPDYRVFLSDLDLEVQNFSNRPEEGMGTINLTGSFMGSGPTEVKGSFRPEKPNPDFQVQVRIVKTSVERLNKVLQAHGQINASQGTFAFFSDMTVKNNRIEGYVKPFLKDVEVYDPDQDKDDKTAKKLYEAVFALIDHLEKQAELGLKFGIGQKPLSNAARYNLYSNELILGDNTLLFELDNTRVTFLNHSVINYISTRDEAFNRSMHNNLQNLIRKSIPLSVSNEKERVLFFNRVREKIRHAARF